MACLFYLHVFPLSGYLDYVWELNFVFIVGVWYSMGVEEVDDKIPIASASSPDVSSSVPAQTEPSSSEQPSAFCIIYICSLCFIINLIYV